MMSAALSQVECCRQRSYDQVGGEILRQLGTHHANLLLPKVAERFLDKLELQADYAECEAI
jgi:hypothetical protein